MSCDTNSQFFDVGQALENRNRKRCQPVPHEVPGETKQCLKAKRVILAAITMLSRVNKYTTILLTSRRESEAVTGCMCVRIICLGFSPVARFCVKHLLVKPFIAGSVSWGLHRGREPLLISISNKPHPSKVSFDRFLFAVKSGGATVATRTDR